MDRGRAGPAAELDVRRSYPPWEPDRDSALLATATARLEVRERRRPYPVATGGTALGDDGAGQNGSRSIIEQSGSGRRRTTC